MEAVICNNSFSENPLFYRV